MAGKLNLSMRPAAPRDRVVGSPPRSRQAWHQQSACDDSDSCDVIPCLTVDEDGLLLSELAGNGIESSQDDPSMSLTAAEDVLLPSEPGIIGNGNGNATDSFKICSTAAEGTAAAADLATLQTLTAAMSAGFAGAVSACTAAELGLALICYAVDDQQNLV